MNESRRVVLLIETSREYGRGLLRGVARYLAAHGPWSVFFEPHGMGDPAPAWLARWEGDGVLARVSDRRLATTLRRLSVPVIDLRGVLPGCGFPFLGVDNAAVADLAAGHLTDRGLRHFGFFGALPKAHRFLDERRRYFAAALARRGFACDVFALPSPDAPWEEGQVALTEWVRGLPRPVGVMTCDDERGRRLLDACRRTGAAVPDEVAVVSVDDDPLLCELSGPPLTSVNVNPDRVGYEAAALLDRLMAGEPNADADRRIPPQGIATRRSTDLLAVDDPVVAAALRFIRDRACERPRVKDVLDAVVVSRTVLEQRFRTVLGRTPKAEILRVQLTRAQQLLRETDLPTETVARRCGFKGAKYLGAVFNRHLGMPPGAYRRSHALPGAAGNGLYANRVVATGGEGG